MSAKLRKPPSYRLHKGTGQAIVTLNGKDIYLGVHGTAASREAYDRTIAQWYANGRTLLATPRDGKPLSVTDVITAFGQHARRYYVSPLGTPTSELDNYRQACRPLYKLYGSTPARDFGPLALQAVRDEMVRKGWTRANVNKQVNRLRSVFKWAASKELIPASVCEGLRTVAGLMPGRGGAKESSPVKPVAPELVEAVRPFVSAQVWAIIQLQYRTGARPGEIVKMRAVDIDTSGEVWVYRPPHHKTAHHGHDREIYIGPEGQEVIRPFLADRSGKAFLFSAAEAEEDRRAAVHRERKTPLSCGNAPGTNVADDPTHQPGPHYDVASYRRAIARACEQAFPPPAELQRKKVPGAKRKKDGTAEPRWETDKEWSKRLTVKQRAELAQWQKDHHWHPHQLRHNMATDVCRAAGIEMAKTILGHRSLTMAQLYAEPNRERAKEVIMRIG